MINIGNDKKVVQPCVAANGMWNPVAKEYVMVNGEWEPVFTKTICRAHFYSYGKYLETRTCEKGGYLNFMTVPLVYGDDVSHYGWVTTYGATERKYYANARKLLYTDIIVHALYEYYPVTTVNTLESTYDTGEKSITISGLGPDTIEIEGVQEIVTKNYSTGEIISTEYKSIELKTDGTAPYVKIGDSYVEGTLGNADGATSITADVVHNDSVYFYASNEKSSDVDTMNKTETIYTSKLIVHYKKYSGTVAYRSSKE